MIGFKACAFLAVIFWVSSFSGQYAKADEIPLGSRVEIDRIDILGVKAFSNHTIEGTLEVSPGDRLERLKVVRTEENLQSLYVSHGYEEVRISSRLVKKKSQDKDSLRKKAETVLEFEVTEGRPVRITEVRLVPLGLKDKASWRLWKAEEEKMREAIKFSYGDLLDQSKIAEAKRSIQELLASQEYVGARVEDVKVTTSSPANQSEPERALDAARWVTVEFHIDVGDKVVFGFRGNTVFTRGYLNSLIDAQRVIGLGNDYVNVIRVHLEEEYRAAGYDQVEITPLTMEGTEISHNGSSRHSRRVTYMIREGPLVRINSLEFDGNFVFSAEELQKQFYKKAPALIKNGIYVEKDVQKAAEFLIEHMKEKGFLVAKLIAVNANYLPKSRTQASKRSVNLLVYLYEGDQTLVQHISISGASVFTPDEVKRILKLEEKKPLDLFALGDGIENLKKAYREKGYLEFRILNEGTENLVTYKQENRLADINLEIEEGGQYRVSRIEVEGLHYTKNFVVQRELSFKEGEVLTETQLVDTERKLRRLGIFSNVAIRPIDDSETPGTKVVKVVVHEADRGVLTGGPGLRNDLGVRLFGQLAYTNLWGLDHTALLNMTVNRRFYRYNFMEGQAQFSYIWPWFGYRNITFRPAISVGRTQYINFAADTLSLTTAWEKVLLPHPLLVGSFTYALETIHQFNATESVNNDQLLIGSVTPKISIDMRDNSLLPTSGLYSTAWIDLAAPVLGSGSEIGFYRVQFRSDYHIPVLKDVVWYFSFRTGFEQSFGGLSSGVGASPIPLIKQFALGGIGSLRGYQEQELNYQNTAIKGKLTYVNYRTQLDLPFSGALKFGVFADAANLLINDYSLGDQLLFGTGFGFHYQTPVGPVNLDWGFKVNPPAGSDIYVIHFSVGVI